MALLDYEKVSLEKDSEGGQTLTLHLSGFNSSGNALDNKDDHQLMLTPEEWFKIRNAVNKLMGE